MIKQYSMVKGVLGNSVASINKQIAITIPNVIDTSEVAMKMKPLTLALMVSVLPFSALAEPENGKSRVIGEATGDLDKDGINEKVIVVDTGLEGDIGTERGLLIYKQTGGKWGLWHYSQGAVLPSRHGGMMGDPFESMEIARGTIVISHFGGSRQKWNYTHRYRYGNGTWNLIGATTSYGAPCEGFTEFDYNLVSGKAIYSENQEPCPDENTVNEGKKLRKELSLRVDVQPGMDGFYPGNNKIHLKEINKDAHY